MEESELESASFLEKFGCMQTLDQEDLVTEMLRLIGPDKLSGESARFYLEMNMWNVQSAVCSYFDLESGLRLPSMSFLQDLTIGEGESVPPNTPFLKTWKLTNDGSEAWPNGCTLRLSSGTAFSEVSHLPNDLAPAPGIYEAKWRMATPSGLYFGDPIFVIISVELGGTLALTQQLNDFSELGQSPERGPQPPNPGNNNNNNPFAQHASMN
ncbi:Putative LOC102219486 [Caligus rogercresseyi]|uniref:LOC102219486 n=1 Tax=Caligus rogercresseyi TaxID=217165 RepID=A0A7T8QVV6_CALRO|nr:Putative LOC102219486 [Caligus rogercresseyi]